MTRKLCSVTVAATVAATLLTGSTATPAFAAGGPLPRVSPEPDATTLVVGGRPASQVYRGHGSLQQLRGGDPNAQECGVTLWIPPGSPAWRGDGVVVADHAVTNAHCVTTYPAAELEDVGLFRVRFDSNDRLAGGIETGVSKVVGVYPTWAWGTGTGLQGDIAVLRLTKPVRTKPQVLTLPASVKKAPVGPARIVGWGWTSYPTSEDLPRYLSELDTAIVDPSHCAAAAIDAGEVCVADLDRPDKAACIGDSGSPVMVRVPRTRAQWFLIGTASRETAVACAGPVVYTSVLFYADWINRVVAGKYRAPDQPKPTPNVARSTYRWVGCGTSC